jgi:hypothetical protein
MMRICFILFFGIHLMGCTKPIQMEIPKDHPANPFAGAAPETDRSDYRYHLPHHTDMAKEPGLAGTESQAEEKTGEAGHESMSPKGAGGAHDH